MLGRAASDIYWMTRYMERAENLARLLEVGYRLSLLPQESGQQDWWRSTLRSAGCEAAFDARHDETTTENVVHFLVLDRQNPSSVQSCLTSARENARAQRTSMTRDTWECLNGAWIEFSNTASGRTSPNHLPKLFDWIKQRSALFRGTMLNTMLRDDTFQFSELGTFIERADNTARILDVKYYVLLPRNQLAGTGVDHVHWKAILRSVSAHRSYRWVYRETFKPWNIADFLILRPQMPRSLHFCYSKISTALSELERRYDQEFACSQEARRRLEELASTPIDSIFQSGLHEFLLEFLAHNNRLNSDISTTFHFQDAALA